MSEEHDCRACKYLEFVSEEIPSLSNLIFAYRYYRCKRTGEIMLTLKGLRKSIVEDLVYKIDTI